MAINFCMNCGAKLEAGAIECASCHEPVPTKLAVAEQTPQNGSASGPQKIETTSGPIDAPASKQSQEVIDAPEIDLSGFDVFTTEPAPQSPEPSYAPSYASFPGNTDVMAPVNSVQPAYYHAPQEKKSNLGLPIKIAAVAAVIIIAFAAVGLLSQPETQNMLAPLASSSSQGSSEASSAASSQSSETSAASSATSRSISDAKVSVDDDTAFEYLTDAYNRLSSYNQRIASCVQSYNGYYIARDRSARTAAANACKTLMNDIQQDMRTLDAMNINKTSALYDDYENVKRLQNDEYQRVAVLYESWEISLQYDEPYEHSAEILAPLLRDNDASGNNIYLVDFDNTYYSSRPER